ncbi:hypothetical protein VB712_17725 [Spirulina sp. CCNP1310]|uniref:hypothetical protein n=1 Tax=Spirulina sp. CCNP1310 TaxID=3110249 RepID=UPI002B1F2D72|nr:hypothetical protein [Spirulina sp. CCNP1310]MEA5421069.1 hypothetical protein [Spirulina sp. CCNP1310]
MKTILPPAVAYPRSLPLLLLPLPSGAQSPTAPRQLLLGKNPVTLTGEPLPSPSETPSSPESDFGDPLNSPYPIPWQWILSTHQELQELPHLEPRYYRSPAMVSPDGQYAAYSRLKMAIDPRFFRSTVSSVMFLEDLKTGELQTITAASPVAVEMVNQTEQSKAAAGMASVLLPVSWSEGGDRLLARQFEGLLSTSIASDYAVIWDRHSHTTQTLSPKGIEHSNAVLLGWSQLDPEGVLFRAGVLGEEPWLLWLVNRSQTQLAAGDQPIVHGQRQQPVWSGAQLPTMAPTRVN